AVGYMRTAARFPVVVPQLASIARVESPDMVGGRRVEHTVHHKDGALFRNAAGKVLFQTFTADDSVGAGCGIEPCNPTEGEVLDGVPVHLLQRAVALAGVVAGVRRPGVRERLEE